MSKRAVFGFAVAAVVFGGLYVAGDAAMAYKTRQVLAGFQQNLPAGSSFTYDTMESSLFLRQVTLTNLKVNAPSYVLVAGQVVVQGVPKVVDHRLHLGRVAVSQAEITLKSRPSQSLGEEPIVIAANTASVDNLDLQTGVSGLALLESGGGFDAAEVFLLQVRSTGQSSGITISNVKLGDYHSKILSFLQIDGLVAQLNDENADQKLGLASFEASSIHIADIIQNLATPVSLLLRDVVAKVSLRGFVLSGGEGGELRVGNLQLLSEGAGDGYRKSLQIDVTDSAFPVMQAPDQTRAALGLTSADGVLSPEMHIDVVHDAATRILEIKTATLTVPGQGALSVRGALSGVSSLMLLENRAGAAALSFNGLQIDYNDLGFAKRRVQSEAQRMAVMPTVYAEQIMNRLAPQLEPLGQRGLRIRNALYAFLLDPHYLSFSAKPAQPVSMLQLLPLMRAPAQVADLLRIFVSSEPVQSLPASTP